MQVFICSQNKFIAIIMGRQTRWRRAIISEMIAFFLLSESFPNLFTSELFFAIARYSRETSPAQLPELPNFSRPPVISPQNLLQVNFFQISLNPMVGVLNFSQCEDIHLKGKIFG